MRLVEEEPDIAAISADARSELPEPTALDDGGRREEAELASGVLLRLPIMW